MNITMHAKTAPGLEVSVSRHEIATGPIYRLALREGDSQTDIVLSATQLNEITSQFQALEREADPELSNEASGEGDATQSGDGEVSTVRLINGVIRDISPRANLRGANLGGANLGGADLGGADLRRANLYGALNLGDALNYLEIIGAPASLPEGWRYDEGLIVPGPSGD